MDNLYFNAKFSSAKLILISKQDNIQITETINSFFKKEPLTTRDRNIITDLVNGPIRMSLRLKNEIVKYLNGDIKTLNPLYVEILKISIYEILFTEKPNYAIVNSTVDLIKLKLPKYATLTNAILRNIIRGNSNASSIKGFLNTSDSISIEYSHPKWLIDKWLETFNKTELYEILNWNNLIPKVWFRIRDTSIMNGLLQFVKKEQIQINFHDDINNFFSVDKPSRLINNSFFNQGKITIQSPVSSLVVDLMNISVDANVYDLCSSPGGKSSLILDKINPNNSLKAFDINQQRGDKLKKTLDRLNLHNFTYSIADATKCKFDNIDIGLCDVPCSGTGTIGKKSDLRWRISMDKIITHSKNQLAIINNISKYIKRGGALIYSTCSIENEENWGVVDNFLKKNTVFFVEDASKYINSKFVDAKGALNIIPHKHGLEGGFAVRLVKNA